MEKVISFSDCVAVIQNYLNLEKVSVHGFEILPTGDEYPGYLGDYCRLRISFDDHGNGAQATKQFFVKTLPIENFQKREVIKEYGIFKKEQLLYKHLVPKLKKYTGGKKWCPTCYLSKSDLIILEDLRIDGYEIAPINWDFDTSYIHEALKTLSSFHMGSLVYEIVELKPLGTTIGEKYEEMLHESSFFPENTWFQCGLQAIKSIALSKTKYGKGSKFEPLIKDGFDDKIKEIYKIVNTSESESRVPQVWCNRDIWKNNLMYKFEKQGNGKPDFSKPPQDCILIDFQISRYLPLTIDLLIVIIVCSRRHHYEKYMEHYLEFYYQCLRNELIKHDIKIEEIMTWDNFKTSCNDVILVPLIINPLFMTLTHLPSGVMGNLNKNDPAEYDRVVNVKRDELVFKYMEIDLYYHDCLIESVEALIEHLFDIKN